MNIFHSAYSLINRIFINRHQPTHIMLYNVIEPNKLFYSYLLTKIGSHKLLIAVILFLI